MTEKYYGVVVSRVRKKIELVESDLEALEQHETLADELRDAVCEDQSDEWIRRDGNSWRPEIKAEMLGDVNETDPSDRRSGMEFDADDLLG